MTCLRAFRFVLALVAAALPARSSEATIMVRGARSCGEWVEFRRAALGSDPFQKLNAGSAQTWLLGFVSGLSMGADVDVLGDVDNPSLFLWMDNYCKANPLKSISDGGMALVLEVRARPKVGG